MKKILAIILPLALLIQSCDKDDAGMDGIDLSNSIPPYVELTSIGNTTVSQDTTLAFTFQMRTAFQEPVTVTYSLSGAINQPNKTVIIDRNKFTASIDVVIPDNIIVAPATTAQVVLTLNSAQTASGRALTIGAKNQPATQKKTINITL